MATYENAIPYIQKAEGGLSRATTDTASKSPSPYVYQGVKGWHTNRGITWDTFKGLAPKAGYSVSQENFINMPDSIWLKIYKVGFWDEVKGDLYLSQAIANAVVDFAWAGGTGGAKKALIKYLATKGAQANGYESIAKGFNDLVAKEGEAKAFNDLIDERKRWFLSLNQPANNKTWLGRMEALRAQGASILGKGATMIKGAVKTHPAVTIAVVAVSIIGAYVLYKTLTKK